MNRRAFIGTLATPLLAQSPKLSGVDAASQAAMSAPTVAGQIQAVLTRGGSNLRHGTYLAETILTPASIARTPPRLLFSMKMPGDPRIESQPLLVPSVTTASGEVHDLCIVSLMSNHVCAFDANMGRMIWTVWLGTPVKGSTALDDYLVNVEWGILSTGVIDGTTLYVVAWISPDGTPANGSHWLYAIAITTGFIINKLLLSDKPAIWRKQRASLTISNIPRKTIFIPWGTVQEVATGAHGYITAVDVATWKVQDELTITPDGFGGGIWMAGQGLAVDAQGFLYCMTANGTFDGVRNFGECFIKVQYDGVKLTVVDWWSPYLDSTRGADPAWSDMDLGSGGPVVLPDLGLVLGAGKDGILYPLNWQKMGQTKVADFAGGANYRQLKASALWFTYYSQANPMPVNPADLNVLTYNRTHHMHSTPVAWQSETHGWMLFCGGENGNARAWSVNSAGVVSFLANGAEVASAMAPVPPGGMPGMMLALSANGNQNGILWASSPDGDANKQVTTGRLLAYDAQSFGQYSDGTGALKLLWQSGQFTYDKFLPPVVSGGKIYVGTYGGTVDVYG